MSKPIKLTEELLQKIQEEFVAKVKGVKMFDGKLEYSRSLKWEGDEKATVYITSDAFSKMTALVQQFDSEVAWHGVVHRDEDDPSVFYITDILVYPQIVSGATVNTDQEAYQTWLYSFDDDVFNNIRMQGHSHVSMGVTPSGVDVTHQEKILDQMSGDDYYIFMIWNKRFEYFVRIFDLKSNTLYETEDVDVYIGDSGIDLNAFVKSAKEIVKRQSYSYQTPSYHSPTVYHAPASQAGFGQSKVTTIPASAAVQNTVAAVNTVKSKPKVKGGADVGMSYRDYQQYGFPGYDDDDGVGASVR